MRRRRRSAARTTFFITPERPGRHPDRHGRKRPSGGTAAFHHGGGPGQDHELLRDGFSQKRGIPCDHQDAGVFLYGLCARGTGRGSRSGRRAGGGMESGGQQLFLHQSQRLPEHDGGRAYRKNRLYLKGGLLLCGGAQAGREDLFHRPARLRLAGQQKLEMA